MDEWHAIPPHLRRDPRRRVGARARPHYRLAQPGLLVWRTDADEQRVRDAARELVRQVQPLVTPLPSTGEAASQRGREVLNRNTVFRDRFAVFARQMGVVIAALAVAAAIVLLVPASSMAIALALALTISVEAICGPLPSARRLS